MKRIIPFLILTLIIILPVEVKALSVNKNNLTIKKGENETIDLSTTVEKEITAINFTLTYTTYDIPAFYNIAPSLTDATPNQVSHKITLKKPTSGTINLGTVKVMANNNGNDKTGEINIYNAKAITKDGEVINLKAQTINIIITTTEETKKTTEDKKEEKKHLLDKIESNIVNIELQDGIYEYTVKIKEKIKELDLKPIAKDSKYKIEISEQKISGLEDNQIIITVKNGEEEQQYKIKIEVLKVSEIEIDNSEFESTYEYKNKWIIIIITLSIVLFVGLLINKKSK